MGPMALTGVSELFFDKWAFKTQFIWIVIQGDNSLEVTYVANRWRDCSGNFFLERERERGGGCWCRGGWEMNLKLHKTYQKESKITQEWGLG